MNKIAIIPAKGKSTRIPNKNMLDFKGKPLFMWSVEAALDAGIKPVVYTDSDVIKNVCSEANVDVVSRDPKEDEAMETAITAVLNAVEADAFVMLQPTSPLRVPGLIVKGFDKLEAGVCSSAYTYSKVKPIGQFGETVLRGGTDQQTKEWFKWFDGNMLFSTVKDFTEKGTLLHNESVGIENMYPASLQIDWEPQMDALLAFAKKRKYRVFVPGSVKTVAVVSNKERFDRNYSKFIDGCDAVLRCSKMDNIDTGTAGTITDMVFIANSGAYRCHSHKQRHSDMLTSIPVVWHLHDDKCHPWHDNFPFNNGVLLPRHHSSVKFHTTYQATIELAYKCWSRCHVYGIGTMDLRVRTGDGFCWHKHSNETLIMDKLIREGRLTIVDEDNIPASKGYNYKYST